MHSLGPACSRLSHYLYISAVHCTVNVIATLDQSFIMAFESGRFLHPFDTGSKCYGARSWSAPVKYTSNVLTEGRIPRLIEPRTLFGATTIGERFVIATGGQKPNFPALSSVELFVRTSTECHTICLHRSRSFDINTHCFSCSARASIFVPPYSLL